MPGRVARLKPYISTDDCAIAELITTAATTPNTLHPTPNPVRRRMQVMFVEVRRKCNSTSFHHDVTHHTDDRLANSNSLAVGQLDGTRQAPQGRASQISQCRHSNGACQIPRP
jgi:hypothetical protein